MPQMEEGSILYMPTTLPGVPIAEAGWMLQQMDKKLKAFPEVESVFGKLGRADTATDAAPVSMIETHDPAQAEVEWRPGMTKDGSSPRWTRRCRSSATSTRGCSRSARA